MPGEIEIPATTVEQISELAANATDPQRRFMRELAERQREPNHGETAVQDLLEFFRDRQAAVAFLKSLADIGCGTFVTGRRGRPTRIEWADCGAIPIAKTFLFGSSHGPQEVSDREIPEVTPEALNPPETSSKADAFHRHTFLLRPGLSVRIELPLDLSKEEANRLAEFIRAIPF